MSTDTLTLAERIEAVLVANGFPKYNGTSEARAPHFALNPGVGVNVGIAWRDAPDDERALLLAKYENRLRAIGLKVTNRGGYLYVAEPPSHLWSCGCLRNDAGAHRVGCPEHPEGVRG